MTIDLQKSFFNPLTENRIDAAVDIFDEDASFFFPGVPEMKGKRAIRRLLGMVQRRFSELHWKTEPEVYSALEAGGTLVISRWAVHGLFSTGKKYDNEGVSVLRLNSNGKVVFFKDYFTSTDFSDK